MPVAILVAMPKVAVVTDSTASLPAEVLAELAESVAVVVVPLQVVIGATSYDDGVDPEASPEHIATALREFLPVSTSRPSPDAVLEVFRAAAAAGAEEIVAVHLSGQLSGTYESSLLAARRSPVPVTCVDTGLIGAGVGLAALAAARTVAAGGDAQEAAAAARACAAETTTLFYVDTLEYLRRGGRVGAAAALVGSALAVKPILEVVDGRIAPRDKVRTAGRALARLADLAVAAAQDRRVQVSVAHLANLDGAEALAAALADRLATGLEGRAVHVAEVGAALGAHVGPGLVAVVVAPAPEAAT